MTYIPLLEQRRYLLARMAEAQARGDRCVALALAQSLADLDQSLGYGRPPAARAVRPAPIDRSAAMTEPTPDMPPGLTVHVRRAAALMRHFAVGDPEGVNAIIAELEEPNDGTNLLMGVLSITFATVPLLYTSTAQGLLLDVCADMASRESQGPA